MSDVPSNDDGQNTATRGELLAASGVFRFYTFAGRCLDWAKTARSVQERALYAQMALKYLAAAARFYDFAIRLHADAAAKTIIQFLGQRQDERRAYRRTDLKPCDVLRDCEIDVNHCTGVILRDRISEEIVVVDARSSAQSHRNRSAGVSIGTARLDRDEHAFHMNDSTGFQWVWRAIQLSPTLT